mgnify:CR=1 FL=1
MIPGMNKRAIEAAMRKMGVWQEELDAEAVLIKLKDKELIIKNPSVARVEMMGQETFQISGNVEERELERYKEEDVKIVIEQTSCSEKEARSALEETKGDIAEAIIKIKLQ